MKLRRQSQKKIHFLRHQSTSVLPKIDQKRKSQIKTSTETKRVIIKQTNNQLKKTSSNLIRLISIDKKKTKQFKNLKQELLLAQRERGITAQAYGLYDRQLAPIKEFNAQQKRQIASLTKIMTMLTVLKLSQKFKIQINTTYFRISVNASISSGTIAELDPKQWITVQDLLYGLMLPSGNDAAVALSQNLGAYLYYEKQGELKALSQIKSLDITNDSSINLKVYYENFVNYMNKLAKQFQMLNTIYVNPHGLDCSQAYSTIEDIGVLMSKVIQNEIALRIICTKTYTARLKITIGKKQSNFREVTWLNTNKLLSKQGYIGGKTGQTANAGNCLTTFYQKQGKVYFIIVLGCQGREDRFLETEKLVNEQIMKQATNMHVSQI